MREIRVTGGGDKSQAWNQIKADALGVPLVKVTRREGAPLGAALLAGYGVGLFQVLTRRPRPGSNPASPCGLDRKLRPHYGPASGALQGTA